MNDLKEIMKTATPEEVARIRKMMLGRRPDLTIQRIPNDVKEKFIELSEKEFCKDYGMCLKWLIDMYMPRNIEIMARLDEIEKKLDNEAKTSKRRMADGTIVEKVIK